MSSTGNDKGLKNDTGLAPSNMVKAGSEGDKLGGSGNSMGGVGTKQTHEHPKVTPPASLNNIANNPSTPKD